MLAALRRLGPGSTWDAWSFSLDGRGVLREYQGETVFIGGKQWTVVTG